MALVIGGDPRLTNKIYTISTSLFYKFSTSVGASNTQLKDIILDIKVSSNQAVAASYKVSYIVNNLQGSQLLVYIKDFIVINNNLEEVLALDRVVLLSIESGPLIDISYDIRVLIFSVFITYLDINQGKAVIGGVIRGLSRQEDKQLLDVDDIILIFKGYLKGSSIVGQ